MHRMVIRKITMDDIDEVQFDEIVTLELECGLEPFPPEVLAADIAYEDTWAAFDGEHVAGFITVSPEEGYFRDDLFIFNINVGARWRRKGIASSLIRTALSNHQGCRSMSLDVALTNEKARNLYEKLGFRETDTPSMNGESDIVMRAVREDILGDE